MDEPIGQVYSGAGKDAAVLRGLPQISSNDLVDCRHGNLMLFGSADLQVRIMSMSGPGGPRSHELALPAFRAGTHHFQGHVARGKAAAAGARGDRVGQTLAVQFLGIAAVAADQEEAAMSL